MSQDKYFVAKGGHKTRAAGMCAMEWVAYLAGEPHSASPVCVSPVLTRFCIRFNDRLPAAERQKLRPYLARTIGTRGDGHDDERAQMCVQWLLDTAFPKLLSHDEIALAQLRALPVPLIVESGYRTLDTFTEIRRIAEGSRSRALARQRAEAGAEAGAGAGVEAGVEAVVEAVAVVEVVVVAGVVAVAVAVAVVEAVAVAVAVAGVVAVAVAEAGWRKRVYDAAYARTLELRAELNQSGFELLDRMLPTEPLALPVAEDAEAVCAL